MNKKAEFTKASKQIEIKIISNKGHESKLLGIDEAIEYLKKAYTSNGKWPYIDGVPVLNPEEFTASLLENAEDITLTNQLAGGNI